MDHLPQPIQRQYRPAIDPQLNVAFRWQIAKLEGEPDRVELLKTKLQRYVDLWPQQADLGDIVLRHARAHWPDWAKEVIEGMQPLRARTQLRG